MRSAARVLAEPALESARHRGAEVRQLLLDAGEPGCGVAAPQPGLCLACEPLVEGAVTLDDRLDAPLVELVAPVLADRLEHPVAVAVAADEALVDEGGERVELGLADLLDRLERGAAGEDREPGEELALVVAEQVVRPGDRRPERLLARVGVAAALEQVEAVPEPLEDLLGREDGGTRRGELERERQVVEPVAELRDGVARLEAGVDARRPGR